MTNCPVRYFILNQPSFKHVLEVKMALILDSLRLEFKLYHFKDQQIIPMVEETFKKNPECSSTFKTLPTELFFKSDCSVNEISDLIIHLNDVLNNTRTNFSQVSITKYMHLWLTQSQIYSLYAFCKQFAEHYDVFKSQFHQLIQNQEIQESSTVISVFDEKQIELPKQQEGENNNINKQNDILTDVLELSPNNVCTYFICKQLNTNADFINIHEIKNNKLVIELNPIIDLELGKYSLANLNDIFNILSSVNLTIEEYKSKVTKLFQLFNHVLKLDNKSVQCKCLKIITFLYIIYGIKILDYNMINTDLKMIYNYTVHKIINSILNKYNNISYNYIEFKFTNKENKIDDDSISNEILKKYDFLINVDKDEFINSVFNDLKNLNIKTDSLEDNILLNNPKIINIDNFISTNSKGLLAYRLIVPPDYLKTHKIITPEYLQLLQLTNSNAIVLKDLNPIISKFSEVILKQIYIEINNKYNQLLDTKVSTLILLTKFIDPFLQTKTSTYNKLFILYKTIIPYLYDNYDIKQYNDYFF